MLQVGKRDRPGADSLLGAAGNPEELHLPPSPSFPRDLLEKTSPSGEEAQGLQSRQGVLLPITCSLMEYLIFSLEFSYPGGRREAVFH